MHKVLILIFFVLNINSMTIDNLDDIRADWDVFSDRVMGEFLKYISMKWMKVIKIFIDLKVM